MSNSSNTFRTTNDTLFLVNILNTMYNDNLRQINNLSETLNNLNNSNNQIRNLLVQLLNGSHSNGSHSNGNNRRNQSRRYDNTFDHNSLTNINGRNVGYLVGEYTFPINTNRNNNNNRNRPSILDDYAHNVFENFFQPIEIYPTQTQIESATRRVRYCDIARPINTSCPISMDDFSDNDMVTVIRHCGHTFHTDNIMNWFRTNCRCPVCRYDIREYTSSNNYFNNTQDSSNNNVERNNSGNILLNHTFGDGISPNYIENLLNNSGGIFDASGNYTTNTSDIIASFIVNALDRNRNTR